MSKQIAMEQLTKYIFVLTIGVAVISISRLFYFYPNLILPLWIVISGYLIYKELNKHKESKKFHPAILEHAVPWLIIFGLAFLFEGHGINFGTNMISYLLEGASITLFNTVYFLDEILSHVIMFAGIYILFLTGAVMQTIRPFSRKMHKDDEFWLGVCGILFGLGMGTSLLEGTVGFPGLILSIAFIPGLLIRHYKHKLKFVIRKYPLNYFIGVTLITIVAFLVIWLLLFGSFVEPSAVACSFGQERACQVYAGLK